MVKLPLSWVFARAGHILKHEGVPAMARRAKGLLTRVLREGGTCIPLQTSTLDAQYRTWLQQEHESVENGCVTCRESGKIQAGIVISVVMLVTRWNRQWFADSLRSVAGQRSANWELVVVCPPAVAAEVRETCGHHETESSRIERLRIAELVGTFEEQLASGVRAATGEFIWMLRLGDQLHPEAVHAVMHAAHIDPSADVLYCDDDRLRPHGGRTTPFFKPSWSPELLLSMNYISYAMAFRRVVAHDLLSKKAPGCCVTQYDWVLCLTEQARAIVRIPRVLYHAMETDLPSQDEPLGVEESTSAKQEAIERALSRRGVHGRVERLSSGRMRVRYQLSRLPLVSIVIPTKDRVPLLSRCLDSLSRLTSHANFEICVLDNGSESEECVKFLKHVAEQWTVIPCPGPFNFSAMNNLGAASAKGEYLVFLNDDTEVIAAEWMTIMLEQAMQPEIGAVGAKLLFPNGSIQHGGIVLGVGGVAGHAFRHCHDTEQGYHDFPHLRRNCSAVSAACMMVSRQVFLSVGGFDDQLPVEFNDVDLCLRIRREGYRIVYAPGAVLYHYENATRKGMRVPEDGKRFCARWADLLKQGDPYYNPNLTLRREDWSLNV